MSRINTNVNSLIAQRILGQQNLSLNKSLERLSTGYRINRGSDDPAGLIASEKLRSEKASLAAAIGNAERAEQVVNVAEGGLQEVQNLLLEVQSLVTASANDAGLSAEELAANQQQVDQILQTIDRIASTTSFQGTKLLNGGFDFQTSAIDSDVLEFKLNGAKFADGTNTDVNLLVVESAQHGALFLSTDTALNLGNDSDARFTFDVAGALGSRQFSFASGATQAEIAAAINTYKGVTGVSAAVQDDGVILKSTGYGSDQFVSVDVDTAPLAGGSTGIYAVSATDENTVQTAASLVDFSAANGAIRDDGQDIAGTINGTTIAGKGLVAAINTDGLDISLLINSATATAIGSTTLLTITGGGAEFNIGPKVDLANQVRLGIGNIAARNLGSTYVSGTSYNLDDLGSGKLFDLEDGDLNTAQQIVNSAIDQVSSLRGRLGSFQKNVVGSTINSLNIALENISAAESTIRDTDFAAETAELTRSQILVAAASNTLAIANSQPQNVLGLIG
ncbi:MAG: flagellin [Phycisphaerales bacterium]